MGEILKVTINGEYMETEVDPKLRLVDFLRDGLYLTGTKIGCKKGECGACTIIMDGKAVNSCMVPVMRAMDSQIQTIEGVARGQKQHPLQEEFVRQGAVQCGFCTPGMIMSAKALLDVNNNPCPEEVKESLGGNICRCTGYVKIERAVMEAARRLREEE